MFSMMYSNHLGAPTRRASTTSYFLPPSITRSKVAMVAMGRLNTIIIRKEIVHRMERLVSDAAELLVLVVLDKNLFLFFVFLWPPIQVTPQQTSARQEHLSSPVVVI
mmetsp:Transcript_18042/g.31644  ORF Transcript_18042/g.31644 Transcript_18042/m.31644 type:complete len:107 (-) Transcript_18042:297-617(-)